MLLPSPLSTLSFSMMELCPRLPVCMLSLDFMLLIWLSSSLEDNDVVRLHLSDVPTRDHLLWEVLFRRTDCSQVQLLMDPMVNIRGTFRYQLEHPFGSDSDSFSSDGSDY